MQLRSCFLVLLPAAVCAAPAQAQTDWEKHHRERVAQFERENAALPADRKNVVLVGDSLVEGWRHGRRVERYLPRLASRVLNRGIASDRVGTKRGVLARLKSSVFDTRPSHLVLLAGVNQIGRDGSGIERTVADYEQVLAQVRARLPDVPIIVVTTPPVRGRYASFGPAIRRYNQRLRALAERRGLAVLDLHGALVGPDGKLPASMTSDGLHVNDKGYAVFGERIEQLVGEPGPRIHEGAPGPRLWRGAGGVLERAF